MNKKYLICILSAVASVCNAQVQSVPKATPPPLGPGPLLNRAPNFSQWLMSIKSAEPDGVEVPSQQTKYDQRILVIKTGSIRREITVSTGGQRTEKWCDGPYQAALYPGSGDPVIATHNADSLGNAGFTDYSKTDFPGFEWISRKNYTDVEVMQGITCIVFHEGPPGGATAPAASPAPGAAPSIPSEGSTAYIAADGRLPVLLQANGTTTLYQFEQPPSAPLTLPANVQAALDKIQANAQEALRGPAAP